MVPNLLFCITKPEFHITSKHKAKKYLKDAIKAYENAKGLLSIM